MISPVTIKIPYSPAPENDISLAEKARGSFGPISSDQSVGSDFFDGGGASTELTISERHDLSYSGTSRLLELYTHITRWKEDSSKEYAAEMRNVEIQGVDGESALLVTIDLDWWQNHVLRFANQGHADFHGGGPSSPQNLWVVPKWGILH